LPALLSSTVLRHIDTDALAGGRAGGQAGTAASISHTRAVKKRMKKCVTP
jgi:hypothetical protein